VLLTVSLVVNLLVAGAVGGMAIGHWFGGPRHMPDGPDPGFGPFSDALSREDRQVLKHELARKVPDIRLMRTELESDLAAVSATLRQDPFDETRLRQALNQMRARFQSRMDIGVDLLIGRLSSMSPADRRAFADRLESRLRHGGPPPP
jgi:uncharacterized membrane protein